MTLNPDKPVAFSPLHRLQWEEAQNKHVILYPEGMVELNTSSAEILKLCDGTRKPDAIVVALEKKFDTTDLKDDIHEFLEVAFENGWIKQTTDQ